MEASVPVAVVGLSGATALAVGSSHTCALLSDGTVACWGANWEGQLGDGSLAGTGLPVAVQNLTSVSRIDAGAQYSCALRSDGSVVCWGRGRVGQLGNGSFQGTLASTTRTDVAGIANAVLVRAGDTHACSVRATGEVACWGSGDAGKLGNGATADSSTPVLVPGFPIQRTP